MRLAQPKHTLIYTMASVYKSMTKSVTDTNEGASSTVKRNKQKVLILSSRGVTMRYDLRKAESRN